MPVGDEIPADGGPIGKARIELGVVSGKFRAVELGETGGVVVGRIHIIGDRGEGISHSGLSSSRRELLKRSPCQSRKEKKSDESNMEGPKKKSCSHDPMYYGEHSKESNFYVTRICF